MLFLQVLSQSSVWQGRGVIMRRMSMHMGSFYARLVVRHNAKPRSKSTEEPNYEIMVPSQSKQHSLQLTEHLKGGVRENQHVLMRRKLRHWRFSLYYFVWCVEARFELLPRAKECKHMRSVYNLRD